MGFELYVLHAEINDYQVTKIPGLLVTIFFQNLEKDRHLHQHSLILTCEGEFLMKDNIYEAAIQETYNFCKDNSLILIWQYLWMEWYSESKWPLWARSPYNNKENYQKDLNIIGELTEGIMSYLMTCLIRLKRHFYSSKETKKSAVKEVEQYQRKRTMTLTWKGHTNSTRYLH
ncbi:protein rad9 [Rhizophagus irregularis DAOM 181602=DAOM 197198]|nr:protein rad9 [Rhizophagus irregularis DAOM 181602=DAOM 197198]